VRWLLKFEVWLEVLLIITDHCITVIMIDFIPISLNFLGCLFWNGSNPTKNLSLQDMTWVIDHIVLDQSFHFTVVSTPDSRMYTLNFKDASYWTKEYKKGYEELKKKYGKNCVNVHLLFFGTTSFARFPLTANFYCLYVWSTFCASFSWESNISP
jgi:hypothetical protein